MIIMAIAVVIGMPNNSFSHKNNNEIPSSYTKDD